MVLATPPRLNSRLNSISPVKHCPRFPVMAVDRCSTTDMRQAELGGGNDSNWTGK